ncbi:SSH4 [Candida oxycetoniae]|uniref:SSH4 n=1 Tax=Candida oxycetoniae TaxID=497107 RepID=A0AAI9SWY3_9ASCO|nr:SSH4 [Candida oxycetoniae]KAI3404614.2 SSH4 [Candida oxycetoniae]
MTIFAYSDPTNVVLIIVLSTTIVVLFLFLCIYKVFISKRLPCNGEYQRLSSSITDNILGSFSNDVPREFLNDEESLRCLEEQYDFTNLSPEEQQQYLKGHEFTINHPPDFTKIRGKTFSLDDEKVIKEYGINAFKFNMEANVLHPHYIVADKTELSFINNDLPYCTTTAALNYPLPVRNRLYSDTIYFETKIFEYVEDPHLNTQHFAIGLITKPYPTSFRLPGYNKFSIAYESTGNLKINKPFPTPLQQHRGEHSEYNALVLPPLHQSDVVGFGYAIPTGTIFITRNGKKLLDVMRGCFIDMYPAIGCFSTNAKFQVNLGQSGFVWIEANVRKYGFVSTSDYKKIAGDRGLASLPQYNKVVTKNGNDGNDKILDKGEELPPQYNPEEELDFFGRSSNDIVRVGSSAQHKRINEKPKSAENGSGEEEEGEGEGEGEGEEVKTPNGSNITDEPEEVMDLRERLYEENIRNRTGDEESFSEMETTQLIQEADDIYASEEASKGNKDSQDSLSRKSLNEVSVEEESPRPVEQTESSAVPNKDTNTTDQLLLKPASSTSSSSSSSTTMQPPQNSDAPQTANEEESHENVTSVTEPHDILRVSEETEELDSNTNMGQLNEPNSDTNVDQLNEPDSNTNVDQLNSSAAKIPTSSQALEAENLVDVSEAIDESTSSVQNESTSKTAAAAAASSSSQITGSTSSSNIKNNKKKKNAKKSNKKKHRKK